jgi:membrane fusion protein, multidrug efflux system
MINKNFLKALSSLLLLCFGHNSVQAALSLGSKMPPTVVVTAKVEKKLWQDSILVIGSLSAFQGTILSPEIDGRITKICFTEGQKVKTGDLLIEIYPDIVKAQLDKAQAQLLKSKLDYNRYLKLFKLGYIDQATLDSYKASLDSNQADVNNYQAQLRQRLITAPFDGTVGVQRVNVGDYVTAGTQMVSLQSTDPMRVDFSVPEVYLTQLQVGDKVIINSKAFINKYSGEIYALDSSVSTDTRTINARAKIPNSDHKLVPGSFVEVTIKLQEASPQIMIPQTAIVYATSGNYIYRLVDHKAIKTNVVLGKKLTKNMIVVNSGLNAGDIIINEGQLKLFDGAPVMTGDEFQKMIIEQTAKQSKKK